MKDGGPAFPVQGFSDDEGRLYGQIAHGMTLRDYFAAAALTGACALESTAEGSVDAMAEWAYRQADAMLAERDRREGKK